MTMIWHIEILNLIIFFWMNIRYAMSSTLALASSQMITIKLENVRKVRKRRAKGSIARLCFTVHLKSWNKKAKLARKVTFGRLG